MNHEDAIRLAEAVEDNARAMREWIALNKIRVDSGLVLDAAYLRQSELQTEALEWQIREYRARAERAEQEADLQDLIRTRLADPR